MTELGKCAVCGKPSPDREACQRCEERTVSRLRDLVEFYALLGDELEPGAAAPSDGSKHTKADAAPLPCSLDVLNARAPGGIVGMLTEAELEVRDFFELTHPVFRGDTEQTVTGAVGWLVAWSPRMFAEWGNVRAFVKGEGDGPDRRWGVDCWWKECRRMLDDVERVYSPGKCPIVLSEDETESGEPEACGAPLRMDLFGQGSCYCPNCGAEWPWHRLKRLGEDLPDPRERARVLREAAS